MPNWTALHMILTGDYLISGKKGNFHQLVVTTYTWTIHMHLYLCYLYTLIVYTHTRIYTHSIINSKYQWNSCLEAFILSVIKMLSHVSCPESFSAAAGAISLLGIESKYSSGSSHAKRKKINLNAEKRKPLVWWFSSETTFFFFLKSITK